MALFNFFRKRKPESIPGINPGASPALPGNDHFPAYSGDGISGIEAVYAFMQVDYESKGYNDALVNPDESYKTDNIRLFRHDLLILIDRTSNYYETLLHEIDFHITSRTRAGLIDLVDELKIRQQIILDQLAKVKQIKEEVQNNSGPTERIALSYQRGFMRGLSAISQSRMLNRNM